MKRKKDKAARQTHRPKPPAAMPNSGTSAKALRRWPRWAAIAGLVGLVSASVYLSTRPEPQPHVSADALSSSNSTALGAAPLMPATEALSNSAAGSNWDAITATRQKDSTAAELTARANAMLAAGNPKGAIEVFKQALFLTPEDEDLHYNLGIAYNQSGDITNAEHHYREALRLLPDYPEVHNNLGNLLLHSGRLNEAEKQFVDAIKVMPELSTAHNNLGIVRQRQNRLPDAIACFRKAVQYNTNYWQAHFNLALACLRQGDKDEAVGELQTVLRLNPGYPPAQQALEGALSQPSQ